MIGNGVIFALWFVVFDGLKSWTLRFKEGAGLFYVYDYDWTILLVLLIGVLMF